MTEETTHITAEESADFESAFDEAEETPTEENSETEEETEGGAEESQTEEVGGETQSETSEGKKYKVKHNGQEFELSETELIERAQKGMDYDRVRQDRDSLKNAKEIQVLDRLAKQSGMTRDAYIESIEKNMQEAAVRVREANLIAEGMDEETAARLARTEAENERLKKYAEAEEKRGKTEEEARTEQEKRMREEIDEFNKLYPDVRELPQEALDDISARGVTPVIAYQGWLLKQQEAELAALRQDSKNKKASAGSVKGLGSDKKDAFLSAFDKDY